MAQAMVPGGASTVARPGGLRYVAIVVGVTALYVATGRLGLSLAHVQENATLIWPPTGLSLAALVLFGRRVWPGVLLGATITNAMIGTAPAAFVAIAAGNTLEAVVGATLLTRVARFDPAFARLRDVIAFLVFGVLGCTTVSATIGVGALHLAGAVEPGTFADVWLVWWLGDAGGATVVTPLLLVGLRGRPPWGAMARRVETWGALAALVALVTLAFSRAAHEQWESLLLALLVFPVVVWVGLRLGPRGAIVGAFLTGVVAVVGTAHGFGPFAGAHASSSMFLLWAYVATLGAVAMILAAAVAEREDAEQARERGERERQRLGARMRHTQRLESLGVLAGGIAHDFNNLLVPIRGNADLLRRDGLDAGARNTMLDEIASASVQAAELCRQLLTYAGKHRPEMRRCDLRTVVREMAPLLRASVPHTVDLVIDADGEDVPDVEAERSQLGQVLMNLVVNAAESMDGGAGSIRVSLGVRDVGRRYMDRAFLHSDAPGGAYVVLEVRDDGAGMSRGTRDRIFDPFYTTKGLGRGLGMASVLGIVQAHRGAIKVRSEPGQGTTFEVLFPARERSADEEAEPHGQALVKPPSGTVLLADDEDMVRRVTRRLLEGNGFAVLEARDGAEALELFRERRPEIDAVLLDVSMPRLSGTDALAEMHAIEPGLQAVLMSGYDAGRVGSSPDTPFVQKPFKPQHLLDVIADAVGRARA